MINLGLTRISHLVKQLSPPTWKAVHIAGTNGKGSVAAYLSSLLLRLSTKSTSAISSNDEVRIGRFTSPHLIDRWDCITVNDKPVSETLFLAVEKQVKDVATQIEPQLHQHDESQVTEFELLTATAFEIFTQQQCQVAVVECGLGGRLDATNILPPQQVAVSVITKIGLDHQGLLGDTVEAIAREKAGIIKAGVPVVVDGTNSPSVRDAISNIASSVKADMQSTRIDTNTINNNNATSSPSINLPVHQMQNLETALLAFQTAKERIPCLEIQPAPASILPQILSDVAKSYPGRLQHLSIQSIHPQYAREILLDGAHNPQSATILREYIDDLPPPTPKDNPKKVNWILAVSQGKDAAEIFRILLRPHDTVTFCGFGKVDGMPWVRSTDTAELMDHARQFTSNVHACQDIAAALEYSCAKSESAGDLLVVAGSLYLVSDLLRLLRTR